MSDNKAATMLTNERINSLWSEATTGFHGDITVVDLFAHAIEAEVLAHAGATAEPAKPTDISQRLREYADNPGYSHNDYADTMRAAAEEIERYYGGMLAWKKTAEKKDRDWQNERMGRVDDRIASRIPAQVPAAEVRADDLKAIEKAIDVLDAFGNLPDHMMHPGPWKGRKAEDKIKAARKAISNLRSLAHQSTADKACEVRSAEWISVEDRLPEDGQSVAFVIDSKGWERFDYLNGRVLGGSFNKAWGGFSVPGLTIGASHWMPLPAAPSTADSAGTGAAGEGADRG